MHRSKKIAIFCEEVWAWFSRHKRTLPWRDLKIKDPNHRAYLILVSEVMLQQTQVSRVTISFKNFIQTFPSIEAIARASNREILIAWRGMGYNSRALRLRDAARTIVKKFEGRFPRSMEELQSLKGIGHYTAAAIRNFAFGIPTPCMDVNIRRILHRFFVGTENADGTQKKDDKYLLKIAGRVLEVAIQMGERKRRNTRKRRNKGKTLQSSISSIPSVSSDWHAALMDFGSLVCTKNNPKWELFSPGMKSICKAYGKEIKRTKKLFKKQEPGRLMAGRFVPNRIFRGKIVEALRDARTTLTLEQVGLLAIPDWTLDSHHDWLLLLLYDLQRDELVQTTQGKYQLKH